MEHRRYVVLRHEGVAVPHFDLMLESAPDGALSTWRTLDWPITRETRLSRIWTGAARYVAGPYQRL